MSANSIHAAIRVPTPHPPRRLGWLGLLSGVIIAAATVGAYSRTFSVPLLYDDVAAISSNQSIRHWSTALSPPFNTTSAGRPVLNLTLAGNYAISGASVWSYHVLNLAIHILAGWTLFGIVRRTVAPRAIRAAAPIAFSAALLWTLHPLQTESVTYIVQRAESLMGLFYLLTLYCFIRGAEAGGLFPRLWFALSVAACLLGMATKEVMISAPLMVFLYDRTFLAGNFREALRSRGRVYAALAATWLIVPFLVLSTRGRGGSAGFGSGVPWWTYELTQFPAVLRYLKLSVWPHPLVFNYGTQWAEDYWSILPSAVVVIGLMAAIAGALIRPNFGGRLFGFTGAWFFAILAPSSLVPINRQTAAEHRMYLALVPIVVLAGVAIHRRIGRGVLPVALAAAGGLWVITYQRNGDYRSALVLWTKTVADCPQNPYAHDNLACELENLPERTRDAIAQCQEALRLLPDDAGAYNNLGYCLEKTPGGLNDAIAEYERALNLSPVFSEAHYNLGHALEKVPGRRPEAIFQYGEALRLNPDFVEAHYALGYLLSSEGRTTEAIAEYEDVLRLAPRNAGAHNNLGKALSAEGRTMEAIRQYQEALRLNPDSTQAHINLGNALRTGGRTREAIAQYEEALRLQPGDAAAHDNLGNAFRVEGRLGEAIAQYKEALRLNPNDPASHFNLATALLKVRGRREEAVAHLEATLRIQPENHLAKRILAKIQVPQP